jgi:hypothetical protein
MHEDGPEPASAGREGARRPAAAMQPWLIGILVAAIILMIAIGAFWTSF